MDTQVNTGSFGSMAGGMSDPLQQAMQRRQPQGGSPLNQVTNTAPTAGGVMGGLGEQAAQRQQIDALTATNPQQQAGAGQQIAQGGAVGEAHPFSPENAKMILGSMGNFLRSLTKFHGV